MRKGLSKRQLEEFTQIAIIASKAGGKISKSYFHRKIRIQRKKDDSPVTKADQDSEKEIRRLLEKNFPSHQIIGEEFGDDEKDSEFKWYIDPIDGTLQFIRGLPFWGSVLGLEYRGKMIVGVIHHPALDLSIWAAKGQGCYLNGKRTHCSNIRSLKNATVTYGGLRRSSVPNRRSLFRIVDQAYDDRGFGDCFGHGLVIRGIVDAMIDLKVAAHDISGVKICVEEAGGHFSGLKGENHINAGTALSCSRPLARKILEAF